MGYNTLFSGSFNITPALKAEHREYLTRFSGTRRMSRNPDMLQDTPDPIRKAVGLPLGEQAEFFTGATGPFGQDQTTDILDYNWPPSKQPSLWCNWAPNSAGTELQWDGQEKFYEYTAWLEYLITSFLAPWGYTLNGIVRWSGEEATDVGVLRVTDNHVEAQPY